MACSLIAASKGRPFLEELFGQNPERDKETHFGTVCSKNLPGRRKNKYREREVCHAWWKNAKVGRVARLHRARREVGLGSDLACGWCGRFWRALQDLGKTLAFPCSLIGSL